jgi:hypothetical protein
MSPRSGENSHLVRIVVGERGRVEFESELVLRFGYGAHVPWVTRLPDGTRCAITGPDMMIMRTPSTDAPVHFFAARFGRGTTFLVKKYHNVILGKMSGNER